MTKKIKTNRTKNKKLNKSQKKSFLANTGQGHSPDFYFNS